MDDYMDVGHLIISRCYTHAWHSQNDEGTGGVPRGGGGFQYRPLHCTHGFDVGILRQCTRKAGKTLALVWSRDILIK